MSSIDDIAEMICIANGERFENKPQTEQAHIKTWATSIYEYVKGRDG